MSLDRKYLNRLRKEEVHFIKYTLIPLGCRDKNIAEGFKVSINRPYCIRKEKQWRHV